MDRITVQHLSKQYRIFRRPADRLRTVLLPGRSAAAEVAALQDVSFAVRQGEMVGVVGRNGSGKSTLLKILAGLTAPSGGSARVQGQTAALLELGAGFHPSYTGIENLYLSGALQGRPRAQTERDIADILAFAEIGEAARYPVKTYSSGMFIRLAFAAAIHSKPEILLVDEALAVGDQRFRAKCYRRLSALRQAGATILFVSHDVDAVRRTCDRVLWLEKGRLRMDGDVRAVTAAYMQACVQADQAGSAAGFPQAVNRFGSAPGCILSVSCSRCLLHSGEEMTVTVSLNLPVSLKADGLSLSVSVKDDSGLDLFVTATAEQALRLRPGRELTVRFTFPQYWNAGSYMLAVGLENRSTHPISYYDYIEGAAYFRIVTDGVRYGIVQVPAEIVIEEGAAQ